LGDLGVGIAVAWHGPKAGTTAEGAKGVIGEGGSGRRDAVAKVAESLGGNVESFYFAFGDDDVFTIHDFSDNVSAAAVSMTVGASGLVSTKTIVLLSPEEVDEAARSRLPTAGPVSSDRRPIKNGCAHRRHGHA
jgi:uncharacterized protein with GYD domain